MTAIELAAQVKNAPGSAGELLAEHARPRYVVSRGLLVASSEPVGTELSLPSSTAS